MGVSVGSWSLMFVRGSDVNIELTEEQRELAKRGHPIDIVDPETNEAYVLVAKEQFRSSNPAPSSTIFEREIPEGVRISSETLRRELPELLAQKRLAGQWVAYHRTERIGIHRSGQALYKICRQRGLDETEFYIGWIHPSELIEEEEIEIGNHY